jgi:hypothetical protein
MKNIYISFFIFITLTFNAQVANYVFSQFIGTYTSLNVPGSTVVAQGFQDDNAYGGIPIGFPFMYNNTTYTSVGASSNGWMTFGSYFPNDNFAPISNSGGNGDCVSLLSNDMQLGAYHTCTITNGSNVINLTYTVASNLFTIGNSISGTGLPGGATITGISPNSLTISTTATANAVAFTVPGVISYVVTGTTPNRVFTMQWKRQSRYSNNGTGIDDYIDGQIKLYETSNVVELIYGYCGTNNPNTMTSECGLVGQNNLDFNNRDAAATVNWSLSAQGTMNNATVFFGNNTTVPKNLTWRWTPPAPCTGTPPANTAVSSSSLACMNGNINLNVANPYTLTGLSFVWSSASAATGPFNPINTSTVSAFTATNITSNTWYICTITCTNSSQSFTTAAIAVTSVGSITNTTPYNEGFENVQLNNTLPNCSWSASNPTTICQTYTNQSTHNRIPNTGNKFAAFNFGTNVNGDHFYTNGIQLYAGIIYSAAVNYVTDGATGWSNFALLYGTSQSTTGLTNIAAVSSNITNTVYASLSGTFTVANSALYYIAVKAIGTTNPWFLSWDDLSVTAPCNLNTPSLAVSGGTLVQCAGVPVNLSASGALSYTWSSGPNTASTNVVPMANTTYTVYGSGITGCVGSAVKTVSVDALPTVSITPLTQTMCVMNVATISVNGAVSYTWNPSNSHASTFTLSPTATNMYSVSYTGTNNCVATSTAQVLVSQCVGLNENTIATDINVFPNPTEGIVNMQFANAIYRSLEVIDVTGRIVRTASFNAANYQLDIKDLPQGIYHLKLISGNSMEIKKLIRN